VSFAGGAVPTAAQRLIVLGPTPPPTHGGAVVTTLMVEVLRRQRLLAEHIDTRDERGLANMSRLDLENVRLGLLHAWRLAAAIHRRPGAGIYIQLSQTRWGVLREALWAAIARLAGRPLYLHLLGGRSRDFHDETDPITRLVFRRVLGAARSVWVLSPALRSSIAGLVEADRVEVLENVVADPGPPPAREPGEAPRILFLANLRQGKGHEELLEALRILGGRADGWQVRLVGEGDAGLRSRYQGWIAENLRGGAAVEVVGPRFGAGKQQELAWADLFVFPSSYPKEAQPLVVIEAMAAGLPILSTRWRGIPDTARDDREAVLVAPGDGEALAEALAGLLADRERMRRLGVAGRRRYEQRYRPQQWDRNVPRLLGAAPNSKAPD
jgi:glycosyltransferase involved in cell wall biosynthesis